MDSRMSRLKLSDITNSSVLIRNKVKLTIQRGIITKSKCEILVTSTVEEVGPVEAIGGFAESCLHVLQCTCPPFEQHESARNNLQSKVSKCLRSVSVKNRNSICFPPLGAGVGYTVESVASWMIEAIDEYCEMFPRSSLSDVCILIYEKDTDTQEGFDNVMYSLMSSRIVDRHLTEITQCSLIIGGAVKLRIRKGDISTSQDDVIVNSSTRDLDMSRGRVAVALTERAGSGLQLACEKLTPLESCAVKETAGFNLKCKKIIHCNCPSYESEEVTKQMLKDIVKKCLSLAATNNHKSISFPALGTGNLQYPPTLVAEWMVEEIIEYCEMFTRSSITAVNIVLYDKDIETQKGFISYMKSHIYRDVSDTHLLIYNRIHFDVVMGDLTDSIEDSVVNTTGSDVNLSASVSNCLAVKAGAKYAQACINLRPFAEGSVVKTSAFDMPCKQIIHTNCQPWIQSQQKTELRKTITSCLEMAAKSNHRSVAFPAIGMGNKGYPPQQVCAAIVEAVTEYCEKNPKSSISTVKLYLYERDISVAQLETFRWSLRMLGCKRQEAGFLLAHGTKFTVAKGDLAETEASIIVNSTGSHMMLSGGNVSVALMNRAGEALQDECTRLGPIITGQIVMTEGFGLPCQHVLHVCCPAWKTGHSEKVLRDLIMQCLNWAHDLRVSSIAFPAVGTGMLKYPPESVARCLVHASADFARMNRRTTVKQIMMVAFTKDAPTIKGIEKALDMQLPRQEGEPESESKKKNRNKTKDRRQQGGS